MRYLGPRGVFFGTDAERLAYRQAEVGQWWYATDTDKFWYWIGTQWTQFRAKDIASTAAWGASSAKLLNFVPYIGTGYLWNHAALTGDSDFVATIAGLPGGAAVTYNPPTSGAESCIDALNVAVLGKLVLHNTTRGDSGLINDVNTMTNTITLAAAVPGTWQVGDTITARSQTNVQVFGVSRFFDLDMSGFLPSSAPAVCFEARWWDSAVAAESLYVHQYAAYDEFKYQLMTSPAANVVPSRLIMMEVISQRLTFCWTASGVATARMEFKIVGYFEEAAT